MKPDFQASFKNSLFSMISICMTTISENKHVHIKIRAETETQKKNGIYDLQSVRDNECVQCYLHQLVELILCDAGVVIKEVVLGLQQFIERSILRGGLQGAENKRSHHQVQHDPRQQGHEGGTPHVVPVDPPCPSRVRGSELRGRDLVGIVRILWCTAGHKQEVPSEVMYV